MPYTNRTRSRGQLIPAPNISTATSPNGCSLAADTIGSYAIAVQYGEKQTMSDVWWDGWFKTRKQKLFVFNDLSVHKERVTLTGNTSYTFTSLSPRCTSPLKYLTDGASGHLLAYWTQPCPHQAVLDSGALASLVKETWTSCLAQRGAAKANFLESIAELDKSFKMFQTPLENLSSLIKTLRRNGKRARGYQKVSADSRAYIKFVSSEWLRFRYGIQPIISDIQAAIAAFQKGHSVVPKAFKAKAQRQLVGQKVTSSVINSSSFRVDYRVTTAETYTVKAFFWDRYTQELLNDLGFDFRSIVGLPWELLRYSFVIDWIANVGDFAYANVPRVHFDPAGGQVVCTRTLVTSYEPTGMTNLVPSSYAMSGGVGDVVLREDTWIDRYTPDFGATLGIKADFRLDNWIRATDAFAVAIQWMHSIGFAQH